ncbi:Beta-phenylalanine transaminase [Fusarium oxysporum f. sp. cubense]|uniref:Beta-phenylalanine transaminase n=1 Tax=Fusarium oxysporum f. sp. cubense TaxID=61366 RepID=A0A559KXZ6_FUSOC|nr:Beta-phenylalanine transaminase [Fusarium oxysporum f. sp. cubense]
MPPSIAVFHDIPNIEPKIYDGPGTYSDLVGTERSENPLVTGVWDILNFDEPTPAAISETDEAKYVVKGEAVIKNEWTGETHELKPGSLLWIPVGAKLSIVSSKDCKTVYFEAREMVQLQPKTEQENGADLATKLDHLVANFVDQNLSSKQAIARASNSLPAGSTRAVLDAEPFPLVIQSGQGSTLTSINGNNYIDFVSDFTAGLFGHSNPDIQQAVAMAAQNGFSLGAITELEAQLGESIRERFHSIDLVRFCNSGTEANVFAIGTALAYSGRKKVLVFDHAYHGGLVSFGTTPNELNIPYDFIIGTYGDIERTRAVLSFEIGAIIVEPMQSAGGMRPASKDFLRFLRDAASTIGAVLIFDEVVTSRLDFHGLQGTLDIKPDMTTLGKYLGGGLPFGAFGGRKEIMEQYNPKSDSVKKLSHSGTFNNNIFTMKAAVAASKIVTKDAIDRINTLGDQVRAGITTIVEEAGKAGSIVAVGVGSCVGIYFAGDNGDVLRELCFFYLLSKGIWIGRRGFLALNFAHDDDHISKFLEAFKDFLSLYF